MGTLFHESRAVAGRWQGAPGVGGMWKLEVRAALLRYVAGQGGCGQFPAEACGKLRLQG